MLLQGRMSIIAMAVCLYCMQYLRLLNVSESVRNAGEPNTQHALSVGSSYADTGDDYEIMPG